METVVIRPRRKSDIHFLLDFAKRIGAPAKAIDTEEIEDVRFVSLIEEGLKTESVSRSEIMQALRQRYLLSNKDRQLSYRDNH